MLEILLLATLAFTLPAEQPDTLGPCSEPVFHLPERGPLEARLYGWRPGDRSVLYLRGHRNTTPGARDTFQVLEDSPWTYYVTAVDPAGNESCPGNLVGVGPWPAAVSPQSPESALKAEWFDVAGRKLAAPPSRTGIYLWRRGPESAKVVIVK